jgi:HEPN domain-containing protein
MKSREHAHILLRKAAQDIFAMEVLCAAKDSPDELIGFHAQQAAEKLFKAVLSLHGVPYRRTHDLAELLDLLKGSGTVVPPEMEQAKTLTPFAAEFRYEVFPATDERLDKDGSLRLVRAIRTWAEGIVLRVQ